jgi:hypothetical protein
MLVLLIANIRYPHRRDYPCCLFPHIFSVRARFAAGQFPQFWWGFPPRAGNSPKSFKLAFLFVAADLTMKMLRNEEAP